MNSLDNAFDLNRQILYSREVRSGKRIYYLDIKQNRNGELFIALTESKKILEKSDGPDVRFEKHKLFLYQDDIPDFMDALDDLVAYIAEHRGFVNGGNRCMDGDAFSDCQGQNGRNPYSDGFEER